VEREILAHQLDQLFGLPVRHRSYQQSLENRPTRAEVGSFGSLLCAR
jgi:hypothetical protein